MHYALGLRAYGCVCAVAWGVASTTLESKHREVHSPEGVNGTSLDAQVKICRGSLPRRGELNVPLVIKVKRDPRRAN